jgi:ketosteroid isomerase-like protein
MSTKETVQRYFDVLKQKGSWDSFLAEDLKFTSFVSPVKEVTGRTAYLESTKRFFSMVESLEVRELIVEGPKACALTRYQLRGPGGSRFQSDVAEIFTVRDGKIAGFAIYFDTAPFPK